MKFISIHGILQFMVESEIIGEVLVPRDPVTRIGGEEDLIRTQDRNSSTNVHPGIILHGD